VAERVEIKLRKGEPVERALRRLRDKLKSEGVLDEMKRLRFYEKPSVQRRRRKAKAVYATARQQQESY
jgi:small subunit ribosomal protein S21